MNVEPEESIFAAALGLPPDKRAAYLHRACGKDLQLRQRLKALLRAHEQSGAFMAQPAAQDVGSGTSAGVSKASRITRPRRLRRQGQK